MIAKDHIVSYARRKTARFYIWTIRKQDRISYGIRVHMWSAVSAILLLSVVHQIKLETALQIIFFVGIAFCACLWVFIERRRVWLLNLSDSRLKEEAHQAMADYLKKKFKRQDNHHRDLKDKSPCRTC